MTENRTQPTPTALHVTCPGCGHPIPFLPAGIGSMPVHAVLSHPRAYPGSKTRRWLEHSCNALVEVTPAPGYGLQARCL